MSFSTNPGKATLADARVALSLASQIDSLELRERHLARARSIVNLLRDELARVDADLRAHERELERLVVAAKQPPLPGVAP
jgi:hypothetical protein